MIFPTIFRKNDFATMKDLCSLLETFSLMFSAQEIDVAGFFSTFHALPSYHF